jgi:hypothetical protein
VSKEDLKKRILEDPDFIKCLKCGNSLNTYLNRNAGELENSAIARLLMITEDEVEEIYQEAVDILKKALYDEEHEKQ